MTPEAVIVTPKYGIGDKVKIVNYGHLLWFTKSEWLKSKLSWPVVAEKENTVYVDMNPELVGREALIVIVNETQGIFNYSLKIIGGTNISWFTEHQLEMISKNPNRE